MQQLEEIRNQISSMQAVLTLLRKNDEMIGLAETSSAESAITTYASCSVRTKAAGGVYKEIFALHTAYMRQLRLSTTFKQSDEPMLHGPYTEVGL